MLQRLFEENRIITAEHDGDLRQLDDPNQEIVYLTVDDDISPEIFRIQRINRNVSGTSPHYSAKGNNQFNGATHTNTDLELWCNSEIN